MPDCLKMDSELVGTPGLRNGLNQRKTMIVRKCVITGNGFTTGRYNGAAKWVLGISVEGELDYCLVFVGTSHDKKGISLFDFMIFKQSLQIGFGFKRLGDHNETRCVFIQSMDNAGPIRVRIS